MTEVLFHNRIENAASRLSLIAASVAVFLVVVFMFWSSVESHDIESVRQELILAAKSAFEKRVAAVKSDGVSVERISTLKEMLRIEFLIQVAKIKTSSTLFEITGNKCSACGCEKNKIEAKRDENCVRHWAGPISKIYRAAMGSAEVTEELLTDGWGAPYAIDENEQEFGEGDCRNDVITSGGPDGIFGTKDDLAKPVELLFCWSI